jgi:ferritin-like protein
MRNLFRDPKACQFVGRRTLHQIHYPESKFMSHEGYHEPVDSLDEVTLDLHRALTSLIEELEAVDWYQQRVAATADEGLKHILEHNRDEEKEHAAMVLEWLRRHDVQLDAQLRAYLFTDGDVTEMEDEKVLPAGSSDGSLGIGSLREKGE